MFLHDKAVGNLFRNAAGAPVELVFHNLCQRHAKTPALLITKVNELAAKYDLMQRFVWAYLTPTGTIEFTVAVCDWSESQEGYAFLKGKTVNVPIGKKEVVRIEVASVVADGKCLGYVQRVVSPKFTEVRVLIGEETLPINFASVFQAGTYLLQQRGA